MQEGSNPTPRSNFIDDLNMTETVAFKEWLQTQGPNPGQGMYGSMAWRLHKKEEYQRLFGVPADAKNT